MLADSEHQKPLRQSCRRQAPREVVLSGEAYYLGEVAAALGCQPANVWHWGIAQRNFRVLAPLGSAAAAEEPEDNEWEVRHCVVKHWDVLSCWIAGACWGDG